MLNFEDIKFNNERIETIFKDIVNTYYLQIEDDDRNSENLYQIVKELIDIYYRRKHRHLYSSFSDVLHKFNDEQKLGLTEYLDELITYAFNDYQFESPEMRKEVLVQILKLYDHINLEYKRILIQTDIENDLKEIELKVDETKELNKKSESLNEQSVKLNEEAFQLNERSEKLNIKSEETNKTSQRILEETQNQVNEYHSHNVTILGIFSALVITFSGIFSLNLNGLSQLANNPPWVLGYYLSLSAFFLFDTTFLLLYVIAKLNGKNIGIAQENKDYGIFKCFWYKYPYVVIFNTLVIIFIIIFYLTSVFKY